MVGLAQSCDNSISDISYLQQFFNKPVISIRINYVFTFLSEETKEEIEGKKININRLLSAKLQ